MILFFIIINILTVRIQSISSFSHRLDRANCSYPYGQSQSFSAYETAVKTQNGRSLKNEPHHSTAHSLYITVMHRTKLQWYTYTHAYIYIWVIDDSREPFPLSARFIEFNWERVACGRLAVYTSQRTRIYIYIVAVARRCRVYMCVACVAFHLYSRGRLFLKGA